ncbi:hypothetical protein D3C86_1603150 [compost metagenome]
MRTPAASWRGIRVCATTTCERLQALERSLGPQAASLLCTRAQNGKLFFGCQGTRDHTAGRQLADAAVGATVGSASGRAIFRSPAGDGSWRTPDDALSAHRCRAQLRSGSAGIKRANSRKRRLPGRRPDSLPAFLAGRAWQDERHASRDKSLGRQRQLNRLRSAGRAGNIGSWNRHDAGFRHFAAQDNRAA